MTTALDVYALGLRGERLWLAHGSRRQELPVAHWTSDRIPGDDDLLSRCTGPTLDIGCGPGRLSVALLGRGQVGLGVDVCADAVAVARRRGAMALQRDVFGRLPREGLWQHLLLADGNIGIGGDPIRLLTRCRQLVADHGSVLVDLQGEGSRVHTRRVRLEAAGHTSEEFAWSTVPSGALGAIAASASFEVVDVWRSGDRLQAELRPGANWRSPRVGGSVSASGLRAQHRVRQSGIDDTPTAVMVRMASEGISRPVDAAPVGAPAPDAAGAGRPRPASSGRTSGVGSRWTAISGATR